HDGVTIGSAALGERLRVLHHGLGQLEADTRLCTVSCGAVNLGAWLSICREQIQRDACPQTRLAVLPRDFHVDGAVSSRAVVALPSEQRPNDFVLLPGGQLEGLSSPFSFRVLEISSEELNGAFCGLFVVPERH